MEQKIEVPADVNTVTLGLKKNSTFTLRSILPSIGSEVELVIEDVFSEDRFTVKNHDLYRIRGSNGSMLMRSLVRSRILPGEAYLDLTPRVKLREPLTSLINGTFATLSGTCCIELWVRLTERPGEEDWCRESDAKRDDGLFWDSEATYKHSTFEAEET